MRSSRRTKVLTKDQVLANLSGIASDLEVSAATRLRANEILARHYQLFDDGRDSSRDWLSKMSDEELENVIRSNKE